MGGIDINTIIQSGILDKKTNAITHICWNQHIMVTTWYNYAVAQFSKLLKGNINYCRDVLILADACKCPIRKDYSSHCD